uniref:Uncharacterized protein n=1 Tax=Biomphalaria glabrata TaxID=6526 RepID=A0A2C9LAJ7_BIOGL
MAFDPNQELKNFPCTFNLKTGTKISHQRFLHVRTNVQQDLDLNDGAVSEKVRNLNLLTWVFYNLNDRESKKESLRLNKEVLEMTQRKNLTALGNQVFLSCLQGDKINGKKIFKELQDLAQENTFDDLKSEAISEQAYTYSRLGGIANYELSIKLFKQCIEKCPTNYLWKYGLGLVNRRLTNYNLNCSSPEKMNMSEMTTECAKLMFEIAENGDGRLRGMAYAQLVQLRQYNYRREWDAVFEGLDIRQLLGKALKYGSNNPTVLTACGKSMKGTDIDKAISLLRDSVKLRENGIAYHHLGLSLIKKVDREARNRYGRKPSYVRQLTYDSLTVSNALQSTGLQAEGGACSSLSFGNLPGKNENLDSGFDSMPMMNKDVNSEESEQSLCSGIQNINIASHGKADYHSTSQYQSHRRPYNRGQRNYHTAKPQRFQARKQTPFTKQTNNWRPQNQNFRENFQKLSLRKSKSADFSCKSLDSLQHFAISPTKKLDENNDLVKEAIQAYEKAIEVSEEENITATLCLGDLYMRLEQYQNALAQYMKVIDKNTNSYLISLISAHEKAGNCLQKLSQLPDESDAEMLKKESKEQYVKALSLAADLASRNPELENCESEVWDAFRLLSEEVERMPQEKQKYKEKIKLLELAKKKDTASVIKEMLDRGLDLDDVDMFLSGLKSYLNIGDFESALAFLNMAGTKASLTSNETWSSEEVYANRALTYISASWTRLLKSSTDSRRAFQQMFQMKYGQCSGMIDGEEEESQTMSEQFDVLIVNDESDDTEEGPGETSKLAQNLLQALNILFGLDSPNNLERNDDYCHMREETQLQEMSRYRLVLLLLGDNDSDIYDRMLETVHVTSCTTFLVVNTRQSRKCPDLIRKYKSINYSDAPWQQTTLLTSSVEEQRNSLDAEVDRKSRDWIIKNIFGGNVELIMRLFCFLVQEVFENHSNFFKTSSKF